MTATPANGVRKHGRVPAARDLLLAGLLFCAGFAGSMSAHQRLSPEILNPVTFDHWFESDVPDTKVAMLDRWASQHWRAQRHLLAPVTVYAPTFVAHRIAGLPEDLAIGLVTAGFAGLLLTGIFIFLRFSGLRQLDAVVFTTLAGSSAAVVFWLGVPELNMPAAISLIPALIVVGWYSRKPKQSLIPYAVAAALTLLLSTNLGAVGFILLVAVLPLRKALVAGVASLLLVTLAWQSERVFFPGLPKVLDFPETATTYIFTPLAQGQAAKLSSFLFHSMVMPEPQQVLGTYLSVQGVPPGPGTLLYQVGLLAWVALLGLGIWALFRGSARRLSAVAGLAVLSQLVFYQVYGLETFLYSAEFVPLLVAFVAPAVLSSMRLPALILALVFVAAAGVNNVSRFRDASQNLQQKFVAEHAFTERIAALTEPDRLVVYGARAAAAEGITEPPPPPRGGPTPVWSLGLFPDLDASRPGWHVYFESWSVELIEFYRAAGAAYFVSSYRYGLKQSSELLDEFDARYERLERTPDWVIYALRPEQQDSAGS